MKWTKELPTQSGWYWWRYFGNDPEVSAVCVRDSLSGLVCALVGKTGTWQMNGCPGGEWAGPIEPPEGAAS